MNGRFLLILLILIIWFIIGWWFCRNYLCNFAAAPVAIEKNETCDGLWKIKDGSKFKTSVGNYYAFKKSSFNPLERCDNTSTAINQTGDYLKTNAGRSLLITGYYDSLETNTSILGDLGLARANALKRLFVRKGISGSQINIASQMSGAKWYKQDTLTRGATFSFGDLGNSSDRLDAIKARLFGKPITLYFGTNQDNIALNTQQRTDFTDLIYYLDNVAGAKLDVGGHTDNIGQRASNVTLSQSRAEFVRDYLQTNGGISNTRMNVQGFGPDNPVDTNNTDAGRAKNRRVEVTLN